jgi:hypothetical protein
MILEKYSMGFMGEKSYESLYTIKSTASGFTYHIIIFQFSPYQTRDFGLEINGHDQFHFPEISLCACSTTESYLNAK